MKRVGKAALLFPLSLFLAACGGGDGADNSPPEPVRPSRLALEITFPLAHSSLRGLPEAVVSGTVTDELDGELNPGDIVSLGVNGVAAEVDLAAGYWLARVPVGAGEQQLVATLADSSGNETSHTVDFDNTVPRAYESLYVSADGQSALVYGGGALRWLDFATRSERLVSDQITDSAAGWSVVTGNIRLDAAGEHAYLTVLAAPPKVLEVSLQDGAVRVVGSFPEARSRLNKTYTPGDFDVAGDQLVYVNLAPSFPVIPEYDCTTGFMDTATGDRTELINALNVYLPGPPCLKPIAVDAAAGRLYGVEVHYRGPFNQAVHAIDLATGERTTISDDARGSGPDLHANADIHLVNDGAALLTLDYTGSVFRVDIATGARQQVLENSDIPKPIMSNGLDAMNDRLITANGGGVFALDLASGGWDVLQVSGAGVGSGPDVSKSTRAVVDGLRNRLYLFDGESGHVVSVELTSLQREIVGDFDVPGSNSHSLPSGNPVLDEATGTFYYFLGRQDPTRDDGAFMALDTVSGDLRVVSTQTGNPGPPFVYARGLCLDPSHGLLYAAGALDRFGASGLVSIDLATGARRLVSDDRDFEDWILQDIFACLYDPATDRLLATTTHGGIIELDTDSGARKIVASDDSSGNFSDSMAWDVIGRSVLLHSAYYENQVRAVDLQTGQFTDVASDVATFSYDSRRSLIYSLPAVGSVGKARIDVLDRRGGGRAVIANPDYPDY